MREEAINDAVRRVLFTWDSIEKHKTIESALKYTIGLGLGFTIGQPGQKQFGDYWYAWFKSDCSMELLVGHGESRRTEKVPKKEVVIAASRIWAREKQGQLSLF